MSVTVLRMLATVAGSLLACGAIACGPDASDGSGDPESPGALEYEHSYARLYRLDRRIDVVLVLADDERRECGILTERAYTELEETRAALDRREDYGYDPEIDQCTTPPGAWVHIENFDHSPFACDFQCCHPELARAALVYFLIGMHFEGFEPLEFDGEPYVAIEPDVPCP